MISKASKGIIALTLSLFSLSAVAQDKFEVNLSADLLSRYIWRGFDEESGVSIQPNLEFAWKGFSLSAWSNGSFTNLDINEIDLTLAYNFAGATISVTDYWWNEEGGSYGDYKNLHFYEAEAKYYFGDKFPLTASAAMMFAGGDKSPAGRQNYSTYFNLSYDIECPADITLTPSIGATTTSYMYTDERVSGITEISLTATKPIKITNNYSIPVFMQFIVAPVVDKVYLTVGLSF